MADRELPVGAESGPCYPTERVELTQRQYFEIMPLIGHRARITITDGSSVYTFW